MELDTLQIISLVGLGVALGVIIHIFITSYND